MWETLLQQLIQDIVVPEVARFMKARHDSTGEWPTEQELRNHINDLADAIKVEGISFLNRVEPVKFAESLPKNKAENSD